MGEWPIRSVDRFFVTRIVCVVGDGTKESPVRESTLYYDDDGNLLAQRDVWEDGEVPCFQP